MSKEKIILEEVDKTLNSIEKIPKLDANPFLFTRIKARFEKDSIIQVKRKEKNYLLKPIVLVLVLVINIITVVFFLRTSGTNQTDGLLLAETLNKEYQLNQVQNYNYKLE